MCLAHAYPHTQSFFRLKIHRHLPWGLPRPLKRFVCNPAYVDHVPSLIILMVCICFAIHPNNRVTSGVHLGTRLGDVSLKEALASTLASLELRGGGWGVGLTSGAPARLPRPRSEWAHRAHQLPQFAS